jgi:hypothetical protein
LEDSKRLEIETMGAANLCCHALEPGAMMAAVSDRLLPEMAHLMRPSRKSVLAQRLTSSS